MTSLPLPAPRQGTSEVNGADRADTRSRSPTNAHGAPARPRALATALGASPADTRLITCHVRDTTGASAAGWQAALILRDGNAPLPADPQPDYIGKDLDAIADQLIERYPATPAAR